MTYIEIFSIAVALSMDALSVSVCKGLTLKNTSIKNAIIVGLYFGIFQAIMPFLGYTFTNIISEKLQMIGDFIAFALLSLVGIQMITNNFKENKDDDIVGTYNNDKEALSFKIMIPLAIATSIDALATGVSFAILKINIILTVLFIGCTTFFICVLGVKLGSFMGEKFRKYSEIVGGIVLIIIGIKILIT